MKLSRKISLFMVVMAAGLIIVQVMISLYSFRAFSISSATELVRTSAEIVRVQLTEAMVHGVIDKRESTLERLKSVHGLQSARIVRSPAVITQYGPGLPNETQTDAIERDVLARGLPVYKVIEDNGETIFRGTIPFIATSHGTPNCMQCHQVAEGTVMGAVTLSLSLQQLKEKALLAVAGISLTVLFFAVLTVILLRRMISPVSAAADDVKLAVQKAINGNFRSQIKQSTEDEIGHIAADVNRLLQFLNEGLSRISASVAHLINRPAMAGENQLNATTEMVEILARAAHFKQAIEEDETRGEIHQRLAKIIEEEFFINEFSLYEVVPSKNQILPLYIDGKPDSGCRWCNPEIMVRSETCRARRTGHIVDGISNPGICYAFQPPNGHEDRRHVCLPIIQSGAVGDVLQLVTPASSEALLEAMIPYVSVYLREAAPVLEAKRLMETLRDANLRDPMTGLNNRRFLEEYLDTLLASVQRRSVHLTILMLDLDYFKMVNDTFGHDAGDTVLVALSKTLRQSVRAADMVIRYGGEEFMIILQDLDAESGLRVAENIRATVEKLKVPIGGGKLLQKTISIGIADYPGDSASFWQVVKFADIALYKAKETGRNQVIKFVPEMWSGGEQY